MVHKVDARLLANWIVIVVLAVVLSLPMVGLAQTDVVFWTNHHIEHDEAFQKIIADFETANPDVKVAWRNVIDGGDVDYYDALTVAFIGGTAPDVFYVRPGTDVNFAADGWVYDIDPFVDRDRDELMPDDFIPAQVSELQYNGKWWALPYDFSAGGLYFNQDIFDSGGVAYPTPGATWDDISDMAQKLTRRTGDTVVQWGIRGLEWLFSPWSDGYYASFGGGLFNETLTESVVNHPANIAALSLPVRLMHELEVAAPFETPGYAGLFFDGQAAMTMDGSWNTTTHRALNDFQFDVSAWPFGPEGLTVSATGGAWAMSSVTRVPEEAWALLKAFASPDAARTLIVDPVRSLPPRISLMVEWAEKVESAGAPAHALRLAEQVLSYGKAVPVVGFPFNEAFWPYQGALLSGRMSPEEVAEQLHHDFTVEFTRLAARQ